MSICKRDIQIQEDEICSNLLTIIWETQSDIVFPAPIQIVKMASVGAYFTDVFLQQSFVKNPDMLLIGYISVNVSANASTVL